MAANASAYVAAHAHADTVALAAPNAGARRSHGCAGLCANASAQLASDAHADAKAHAAAHTGSVAPAVAAADAVAVAGSVAQADATALYAPDARSFAGARKSDAAAVAEAYAEAYSRAYVDADDAGPDADTDGRSDYLVGDAPGHRRRRFQCRQGRHASCVCAVDHRQYRRSF